MNRILRRYLAAAPLVLIASAGNALAAASPVGTWIDHTGRGAVEISDCNGALCGRIVWLKSAGDREVCGMQIIGNVRPASGGRWEGGWIYDPEANSKYDVELTPIGDQKLKVLGYAGLKMFGETMTWTRAPADLARCDQSASAAPEAAGPKAEDVRPPRSPVPPGVERPERETNAAPQGANRSQSKQCSIKIDGLGELLFPCPQ
jgi:uncharacterized protein (DUF2147 family)